MKRLLVAVCVLCLLLTGAASQAKFTPKVFMYHLIKEEPFSEYTSLFVRPSDFEAQISLLKDKNYRFLFAEEYQKTAVPSVVITLDDGYEDNYTEMFPILKKYQAKATIFVISDAIGKPGYLSAEQIKEMSDSGLVSIQSHTKTHRDLIKLSNADVRTEFRYSKYIISQITGKPVTAVSFPEGQFTDQLLKISKEYFNRCYGTTPRAVPRGLQMYAIPRQSIRRDLTIEAFEQLL